MLGVGAYRTRKQPTRSDLLPLPIGEMLRQGLMFGHTVYPPVQDASPRLWR